MTHLLFSTTLRNYAASLPSYLPTYLFYLVNLCTYEEPVKNDPLNQSPCYFHRGLLNTRLRVSEEQKHGCVPPAVSLKPSDTSEVALMFRTL